MRGINIVSIFTSALTTEWGSVMHIDMVSYNIDAFFMYRDRILQCFEFRIMMHQLIIITQKKNQRINVAWIVLGTGYRIW